MIDPNKLRELLAGEIDRCVKRVSEQEAKKAAAETERRVRDEVCQIVGRCTSYFSVENFGPYDLRITVQFPKSDIAP